MRYRDPTDGLVQEHSNKVGRQPTQAGKLVGRCHETSRAEVRVWCAMTHSVFNKGRKPVRMRQWMWAGLAAATWPALTAAADIANYSPVTGQRLTNPEPGNWMLYRRTYDGQGYSPLDKINTTNVKNLVPAWTFSTGVLEGHEAPPIVNNGIMFVATPQNQVIALDAKTGQVVWDQKVQDYSKGQYLTLMPLVINGKVLVGGSGGEFGVRGYVAAFDANDGKELWRTFTIPGPGEPGHETWQNDEWKNGGGSAWMTGNYDP